MQFLSITAFLKSMSKQTHDCIDIIHRDLSSWKVLISLYVLFSNNVEILKRTAFAWPRKPSLTFQCSIFSSYLMRNRNMTPGSIFSFMFYFITWWSCLDYHLIHGHLCIGNYYAVHAASKIACWPIGAQWAGFLRSRVNEASVGWSRRPLSWKVCSSSTLKLAHQLEYEYL